MNRFKLFSLGLLFILTSCNNNLYKAIQELKNLPPKDYSYAIEPHFLEDKEAIELKVKELYFAEEVRIGLFKFHSMTKRIKTK
jgi:hypothetical protein